MDCIEAERERLDAQARELEGTISRIIDAIERQGWSPGLGDRLSERELERERVKAQLAALAGRADMYERFIDRSAGELHFSHAALAVLCDAIAEKLRAGDPRQVNRLLKTLVPRVEVAQEKLVLYYTLNWIGYMDSTPGRVLSYTPYPVTHQLTVVL